MTTLANPQAFFDRVRPLFGGKLSQKQVDVLNAAIAASGADKPNSPIPAEARGLGIEGMIEATIGKEGGYSNHPADKGGPTMWGITERVARKNGYTGDMRNLPREKAVAIYRQEYAIKPGFAAVAEISPAVGEELFDTGVNMGPAIPALWFQQCLNALNDGGKHYPDIAEDGDIGPGTLAAFRAYRKARGTEADAVMLKALNALQGARYIELAQKRGANESFLYGWIRTRLA